MITELHVQSKLYTVQLCVNYFLCSQLVLSTLLIVTCLYVVSGFTGRTSSATVYVFVADENDERPTFEHSRYRAVVRENEAPLVVTTVKAHDPDAPHNAAIRSVTCRNTSKFISKQTNR